jgi:hypothetical protein
LQTEVSALEKQTLSLAKDCLPPHMLRKEVYITFSMFFAFP